MKLAPIADRAIELIRQRHETTAEGRWDIIDQVSGGELECFQMDLVADMVERRLGIYQEAPF